MITYCEDNGIAVIPWSPLARGLLSGKVGSLRSATDAAQKRYFGTEQDAMIIDRLRQLAEKRGYSCSQVALAWLYSKPGVTAPVCGVNREQLSGVCFFSPRLFMFVLRVGLIFMLWGGGVGIWMSLF